ncbi:MAG TPA: pyridoxamine 5'-phosphate oxidase family protein [Actinocrinis sp.]|nr:pyridoxamine 5'-phosphate oxidase family protein [Actinocrinis sp.]
MDIDVNGVEVLSRAESIALLESHEVGRLVYTRRALPAVRPVNFAVRGGAVLIWTGSASSLGQAVRGAVVAFEADELDRVTRSGWSVVVVGTAQLVTDETELARARLDGPSPWAPGIKDHLIRIPLTMVTGRWLGEREQSTDRVVVNGSGAVP